jgi:hypothetical protein
MVIRRHFGVVTVLLTAFKQLNGLADWSGVTERIFMERNDDGQSRRAFVKKAAYVAPVIVTLDAMPTFASYGSDWSKAEREAAKEAEKAAKDAARAAEEAAKAAAKAAKEAEKDAQK